MKQTNNAIKFLMAQYRSVFNHAYFKGIASGAVLAAFLAAGSAAQAANTDGILDSSDFDSGANNMSVTAEIVTQASSLDLNDSTWNNKFSSTPNYSAYALDTFLSGSGAKVTVQGAANKHLSFTNLSIKDGASFTLSNNAGSNTHIYGFTSGGTSNDGQSGTLEVNQGSITLNSASMGFNQVSITSGSSITLGGQVKLDAKTESGDWYSYTNIGAVSGTGTSGSLTVTDSTVTLNDMSNLNVTSKGTMTINGDSTINFNGTKHAVEGGDAFATAFLRAASGSNASSITISGDATGKPTLNVLKDAYGAIYSNTINVSNATFTLNRGSTMILDGDWESNAANKEGSHDASTITFSNVIVNNTDGTLILGNDTSGGILNVSGETTILGDVVNHTSIKVADKAIFSIDADQLSTAEEDTGLFATSGGVLLASGSTLSILNTSANQPVDLAEFNISGSSGIVASEHITLSGAATITGDYLAVSKSIKASGNAASNVGESNSSGSLIIKATNLTLGSDEFTGTDALGFYQAEAKNVEFVANKNKTEFVLKDDVILHSVTSGSTEITAENGVIEGDVNVSGTSGNLTVDAGIYTAEDKVTLSASGSLTVTTDGKADSSLTLNEFKLDSKSAGNTILVSGTSTEHSAILNIADDSIELSRGAGSNVITVSGSGAFLISNGDNIEALLLNKDSESGSKITLDAGHLQVTDSLNLDASQFTSGTVSSGEIAFQNSGSLTVNETLTITGNSALDIGTGSIEAKTLKLNNVASNTAQITSGNLTVINGLSTTNASDTIKLAGTGAVLNLGKIESGAAVGGGSVTGTLEADTDSKINVVGSWTAGNLTASGSTVKVDALGALTLNGTQDANGAKDSGLDLAANSITVYGSLTLGAGVAENITVSTDATPKVSANGITENAIDLKGGTVTIQFADNVSFNGDQLNALKNALFSGDSSAIDGILNIGDAKIGNINLGEADQAGRYEYSSVSAFTDIAGENVTNNDLVNNTFNTKDGSEVAGTLGSLHLTNSDTAQFNKSVSLINANTTSNNGLFVSTTKDGKEVAADINFGGSTLRLENGGEAGNVTVNNDATLLVKSTAEAKTILGDVSASSGTFDVQGPTQAKKVQVKTLNVIEGTSLQADSLNVSTQEAVTLDGALKVVSGSATFDSTKGVTLNAATSVAKDLATSGELTLNAATAVGEDLSVSGDLTLNAQTTVGQDLAVNGDLAITGDTKVAKNASISGDVAIGNASTFVADTLTLHAPAQGTATLYVGQDATLIQEGDTGSTTSNPGSTAANEGDTGFLQANVLSLNGGTMIVDPSFDKPASIAVIGQFKEDASVSELTGGALNGNVVAAQNGIAVLGYENATEATAIAEVRNTFASLLNSNNSLSKDNVGAIVYVGRPIEVQSTYHIIADGTTTGNAVKTKLSEASNNNYKDNEVYLGSNSVLAIDENALTSKGALYFDTDEASIFNNGGKVLLVGDSFNTRDEITLFTDKGAGEHNGVTILNKDLTVETLNGLFTLTYKVGDETSAQTLDLNHDKIPYLFNDVSAPVKQSLIAYASRDNNWSNEGQTGYEKDAVHGALAEGVKSTDGQTFTNSKGESLDKTKYVAVAYKDDQGATKYQVYYAAFNSFLDAIVRDTSSGMAAEQATRLSVFGGTAQAALSAGASTYDAISGRMGVGAQTGSITYADNGQGAGLWVTPIYKNHDSDGFGAQGLSYGVDMDLYGVALGGDFTLQNGLRLGLAFNAGSGDADGQGAGAGVSNDFDYYGFALYGGFTYDKLSIVGDVSYTVVDNDVEANTSADKVSASMDSSNLSVGITGQYTFNYQNINIVPHAGLRYTYIDMDDYTLKGANYGTIGNYAGDSVSVFSIPVGVTFAKDLTFGDWSVQPALDLTLTANMGDDSVEGAVAWAGTENLSTKVESEVLDDWTYGATLGVSAKNGAFSFGLGLNYTGASSADEYGVTANARFVF